MSDTKQPSETKSKLAAPHGAALRLVSSTSGQPRGRRKASSKSATDATPPAPAPAQTTQVREARRKKLPRGITEVRWENATVRDSVRYRVRINRKDFKADKLFESYHEAEEFLLMSKTRDGRLGLTEREERAQLLADWVQAQVSRQPFRFYINRYIKDYVDTLPEPNEAKKRSKKIVKDRILGLREYELTWTPPEEQARTGLAAVHRAKDSKAARKPLGDFYPDEITVAVANQFLRQRGETHAPSTVARERGQLQTIWSKLPHLDPALAEKLSAVNPWQAADRSLIKESDGPRERELTEEEEVLLVSSLAYCRNKEVPLIVGLALATGMRRSEMLMLEWRQVEDTFLSLDPAQTKGKRRRYVSLTAAGVEIIEGLRSRLGTRKPKPNERLFTTSLNAFKLSWGRVRRRVGLEDFRLHDARRVAITRMLREMAFPSAVMLSAMTGMQSVGHLEERFVRPFLDKERARTGRIASEEDIRANVGHSDARMTKHYANLGPGTAAKRADKGGASAKRK